MSKDYIPKVIMGGEKNWNWLNYKVAGETHVEI